MRKWGILTWVICLLCACSTKHSPEAPVQISMTVTPIAQSTEISSPTTVTYTWKANPVIIEFRTFVENPIPYGVSRTPDLILYSDGRLVTRNNAEFYEAQLSHQEICEWLNTINQTGFFDFDMSPYDEQIAQIPMGVVSDTVIKINAWRQRQVTAVELRGFIDEPDFQVPSPLRDVYLSLTRYQSNSQQPYRYEYLVFTILANPPNDPYKAETEWPLKEPPLSKLFEEAERANIKNREIGYGLLLERTTAVKVYQAISQTPFQGFVEDGKTYIISARPLLPYESLESAVAYEATIPSPKIAINSVTLTCYASDGTLELP